MSRQSQQATLTAEVRRPEAIGELAAALAVLVGSGLLFSLVFNHETALSYSIGYNLYGAERVLAGEVPYRDFHTLYPPGTVYFNALLFGWFGVSLYTALAGVLVFKTLTTFVLYLCARHLMPVGWSLFTAGFSIVWLRPNGPFKAVPMHYGALFLAIAALLLLLHRRRGGNLKLVMTGIAVGGLALFKHNIGAYALIGSLALMFIGDRQPERVASKAPAFRQALILISGFLIPVVPVCAYMASQSALVPMIRTLAFGPGEFLAGRLASMPSPVVAIGFFALESLLVFLAVRFSAQKTLSNILVGSGLFAAGIFSIAMPQAQVDSLIFYAPVVIIFAGLIAMRLMRHRTTLVYEVGVLLVAAASAFLEAFPRFAREQAVAAMPFVALLLVSLVYSLKPSVFAGVFDRRQLPAAGLILPLALFLIGTRLVFSTYFTAPFRFRSNTELSIDRGRGVVFPSEEASEIDQVSSYVQQRVPEGGYFFSQSYAGSSYLFLSARRNPSGAQFWGGVGVTDAERQETLRAIEAKGVNLIVTSERDLQAEKYQPMREYIDLNFRQTRRIGDVVILER